MFDRPTTESSLLKSMGWGTSAWIAATSRQEPKVTTKNRPSTLGSCLRGAGPWGGRNQPRFGHSHQRQYLPAQLQALLQA